MTELERFKQFIECGDVASACELLNAAADGISGNYVSMISDLLENPAFLTMTDAAMALVDVPWQMATGFLSVSQKELLVQKMYNASLVANSDLASVLIEAIGRSGLRSSLSALLRLLGTASPVQQLNVVDGIVALGTSTRDARIRDDCRKALTALSQKGDYSVREAALDGIEEVDRVSR